MIILGLTGSIGMGKSTTAQMFSEAAIPVYDADAAVHKVYQSAEMIRMIEDAFPGTTDGHRVSREKLGKVVLGDHEKIMRLESIVHPAVHAIEREFLAKHKSAGAKLVVLDIPLLFETNAIDRVDKVLVVTAPENIQRERVLSRDGMTEERFQNILSRQTPDSEKRARADFIIDTSLGMENARSNVLRIIAELADS